MKKVIMLVVIAVFSMSLFISCESEDLETYEKSSTLPDENCPPNDGDCDGYPDGQDAYPLDPSRH